MVHTTIDNALWPPAYTLKKSKRVRRINLSISAHIGLVITVPYHANARDIEEILIEKRHWIEKNLHPIHQQHRTEEPEQLPQTLKLASIDEQWSVNYTKSNNKTKLLVLPNRCLAIYGNITRDTVRMVLKKWLQQHATLHFHPWLQKLSHSIQLPYQQLTIRGQQTRWGSCSADGAIHLNYKLLFLPPELVTHVMIHELCHTIHLDHSPHFWTLVSTFDNHWQRHRKQTRYASHHLPLWIEA